MDIHHRLNKPQTQKGRRFIEKRSPKIFETDKETLVIRGKKTGRNVEAFLNDLVALKKPLVTKLKYKNDILPFEDLSFVEKMCSKYDCPLFVIGLHSKKRPDNIILGRLHDGELLDMFELGITNYKPLIKSGNCHVEAGSKPMLLFSGEGFNEDRELKELKSLLIVMDNDKAEVLRTPWGSNVAVELQSTGPSLDFVLRRKQLPSEDKWKRAMRVPAEARQQPTRHRNRGTDAFGSQVGRIHVARQVAVDQLRPAASMRTALTGMRKRSHEGRDGGSPKKAKKVRTAGGKLSEQARESCGDAGVTDTKGWHEDGMTRQGRDAMRPSVAAKRLKLH